MLYKLSSGDVPIPINCISPKFKSVSVEVDGIAVVWLNLKYCVASSPDTPFCDGIL